MTVLNLPNFLKAKENSYFCDNQGDGKIEGILKIYLLFQMGHTRHVKNKILKQNYSNSIFI